MVPEYLAWVISTQITFLELTSFLEPYSTTSPSRVPCKPLLATALILAAGTADAIPLLTIDTGVNFNKGPCGGHRIGGELLPPTTWRLPPVRRLHTLPEATGPDLWSPTPTRSLGREVHEPGATVLPAGKPWQLASESWLLPTTSLTYPAPLSRSPHPAPGEAGLFFAGKGAAPRDAGSRPSGWEVGLAGVFSPTKVVSESKPIGIEKKVYPNQ